MKLRPWWISAAGVAVIGLATGVFFLPARADQQGLPSSGIVEQAEYDLSFKIGGRIETMSVEEGQPVKKGQVLAQLEQADLQAKVEQAQAAVNMAAANVEKAQAAISQVDGGTKAKVDQARAALKVAQDQFAAMKNGARPEEIAQAEAKAQATKTAYENAQDLYNKTVQLYQAGAVPESKKNEAEVQLAQAKAEYEAAQKQLELVREGPRQEQVDAARHQVEQAQGALEEALNGQKQVQISQADAKAAQAQLEQAKAGLEEAQTYLSYTRLVSPVDGIVIKKNAKVGEMVSAGMPVLTVADPKDKWVSIYVKENELPAVKVGDLAQLNIPAIHSQINGRIVSINPAPQFAVSKATNHLQERDIRSFQVKIKIEERPESVLAGMTAEWRGATGS